MSRSPGRKFKAKHTHQKHCVYCRRELLWKGVRSGSVPSTYPTVDHIVPYSKFEKSTAFGQNGRHGVNYMNCVVVCNRCNSMKKNRSLDEFLAIMLSDPKRFPLVHQLMQEG